MAEQTTTESSKSPSAKKSFLLMAVLLLALIGLAVYVNSWKENRRVAEVVVEGNRIIASKDILSLARVAPNVLLFDLDLYSVEKRVMSNIYVKSVAVHRDIPNRVRISIDERVPVAAIVLDRLYYLDADGYVLPPARSQYIFDLPVLGGAVTAENCTPGKQAKDQAILEALRILSVAREINEELYRNISEIRIDGKREFMFYTAEFGIPVMLGRAGIGPKLVKFDSFWNLSAVRESVDRLEYVDLRFEDQVVVRWNHKDAHS